MLLDNLLLMIELGKKNVSISKDISVCIPKAQSCLNGTVNWYRLRTRNFMRCERCCNFAQKNVDPELALTAILLCKWCTISTAPINLSKKGQRQQVFCQLLCPDSANLD